MERYIRYIYIYVFVFAINQVCEGDTVVVYVSNYLRDGGSLTIHWHGLHMRGTQYMDGVPMVTQCSILPWDKFRLHVFNK